MIGEIPLQVDMFSGELTDTRTATQKRRECAQSQPQPVEMFSQKDIAQFGVSARPLMPLEVPIRLALEREDSRTPEEQERDLQHAAEEQTYQMFPEESLDIIYDEELYLFQTAIILRLGFSII